MSREWKTVRDSQVMVAWSCPDCGDIVKVTPDYFEGNGTPVCTVCDTDMDYKSVSVSVDAHTHEVGE